MFATRFKPPKCKGLKFTTPSLAQSHLKDSCDIGNLIRRALTGDSSVFGDPRFMDVSGSPDTFSDAQFRLAYARTVWADMPQEIRCTYGSPEILLRDLNKALAKRKEMASKPKDSPTPTSSVTAPAAETSTVSAPSAT